MNLHAIYTNSLFQNVKSDAHAVTPMVQANVTGTPDCLPGYVLDGDVCERKYPNKMYVFDLTAKWEYAIYNPWYNNQHKVVFTQLNIG